MLRGIRGATTILVDTPAAIAEATQEMIQALMERNQANVADIAAATFTTTTDVVAAFPAAAARDSGWTHVPMLCHHEIPVPHSLSRCIRVLVLWNTDKRQDEIYHVYLRDAVKLRPDLAHSHSLLVANAE